MHLTPWYVLLLLHWVCAAPTTTGTTGTAKTTPIQTTISEVTYNPTLKHVSTVQGTTTIRSTTMGSPKKPYLLRQEIPQASSQRLRGRVVLANTRMEGNEEWGVNFDQAELACDRIARHPIKTIVPGDFFRSLMYSLLPQEKTKPMEGHLLSVGSSNEVLTLSRLLSPLPDGAYWTGGKLVRRREKDETNGDYKDRIVLTWSDGRVGRPSVLGMTKTDEEELQEGYTYCLALNLRDATWQARDCSDLLPYACLITPRQILFSNQASRPATISSTTSSASLLPSTPAANDVSETSKSTTPTRVETTTDQPEESTEKSEQPVSVTLTSQPNLPKVEVTAQTPTIKSTPTSARSSSRSSMTVTTNPLTNTPMPILTSTLKSISSTKAVPTLMITTPVEVVPKSSTDSETVNAAVDDDDDDECEDDDESDETESKEDKNVWKSLNANEVVSTSTMPTTSIPVTKTFGVTRRPTGTSTATTMGTKTSSAQSATSTIQPTTRKAVLLNVAYTETPSTGSSTTGTIHGTTSESTYKPLTGTTHGQSTKSSSLGTGTTYETTSSKPSKRPCSSISTTTKTITTPKLLNADLTTKLTDKTTFTPSLTTMTSSTISTTKPDESQEIVRAILRENSRHQNEYNRYRRGD
jgi:hypothetical protein